MSGPPLVLVPPSKSMEPGGRGRVRPGSGVFRGLSAPRLELATALAAAMQADPEIVARWAGATGDLLDRARVAFEEAAAWRTPARPTVERLTGVVWNHLDAASLPPEAQARLVVPTALMGLSVGTDPMPDHRLGFGATIPGLGRLDRWWRPHLTDALARRAAGGTVVDMLPQEHAAAIDLTDPRLAARVVTVRFLAAGGRAAAGHAAKAVKGIAARTVLLHGLDALATLEWEGWRAERVDGGIDVVAPPSA